MSWKVNSMAPQYAWLGPIHPVPLGEVPMDDDLPAAHTRARRTTAAQAAKDLPSRLLNLRAELRLYIYELALFTYSTDARRGWKHNEMDLMQPLKGLNLLLTCWQIRS